LVKQQNQKSAGGSDGFANCGGFGAAVEATSAVSGDSDHNSFNNQLPVTARSS